MSLMRQTTNSKPYLRKYGAGKYLRIRHIKDTVRKLRLITNIVIGNMKDNIVIEITT